ncbi:DUF1565 domain-containing protein [bacterium]|nr:MAG: DUF1565 domain-containing protein [bacterium]
MLFASFPSMWMVELAQGARSAPREIFVSPSGNDTGPGTSEQPFRTIQHATDRVQPGGTVTIRAGTYAEAVRLTKSGSYFGRTITIRSAPGEKVVLDGEGLAPSPAIFSTAGQDHLLIRGITVRNGVNLGLAVEGSYRVRVENCRTENTGRSGVFVDKALDVSVSRCEVTKACARGGEESVSIKRSSDVVFEDSEVHDTFHEGIDVKEGSKHVIVRRNRVHHVERQGLYADAWDADTGHIRFENNVVYDCLVGLVACTESGGLLHDVDFVGNVVYDCRGPGMMLAKWGSEGMTHRITRVAYINNTVVNCSGPSKSGGIWAGGMLMENDQAEDVTVMNNVLSGNGYAQLRVSLNLPPKRIVAKNNLIDGVGENLTKGNLVRKARFENAAKKDFRLAAGSPGVNAGAMSSLIGDKDVAGQPRIRGRVDIGAYERP